MNVGPGVVRVVKSAMFVIWETFYLDSSCFPRLEYAWGVASANGVEWKSAALCGRGDGTADGWVAASGFLVDAKGCGEHTGVNARESGVWVDGDVVEDLGERLLVCDQCLNVSHRDLKLINDMALGENRISSLCAERNAMCAWTDSLALARICKQCRVCWSALVEGVLSLGIQRRGGLRTRGEPEVCAHLTVRWLYPPSGVGGGRWGDLDARPRGKC